MNSLISINNKFMEISPKELVAMIMMSKHTKGIEIYINYEKDTERKYLDDLVFEIKKNDLILQVHGNIELNFDTQLKYVKTLEKYADILGYPIVFTLHTFFEDNLNSALKDTINYIGDLINSIDNEKIVVSLENLNSTKDFVRLSKEYIKESILNDERLYFTYDLGHEIVDHGKITNLDNYIIDEIRNVHLHSHNEKGVDHQPIYKHDPRWNEIMKGLVFLINHNYKYNIVYEYDLFSCHGVNIKDKIEDFLNSIDYVSEKYGSE